MGTKEAENSNFLKTVSELMEMSFFIPSYQRGYRWNEEQVEDLLNDIDNFILQKIKGKNTDTWYCLQPIVVQECDEDTRKRNSLPDKTYEVIDGQQRLTTFRLIVHYINEMWRGEQKDVECTIRYETRPKLEGFIDKLKVRQGGNQARIEGDGDDNVDAFHISQAYRKIHDWVTAKRQRGFDDNKFQSNFKKHSKVIWYEPRDKQHPTRVFIRINIGKIPLTNAELIKALFLNSSNFNHADCDGTEYEEITKLKQLEIASEWDRMEYELQDNEFWHFINVGANKESDKSDFATRIEFIFKLMRDIKLNGNNVENQYGIFKFFADKFDKSNSREKEAENIWKEIKQYYYILREWFSDRELYHKIGYLLHVCNFAITDLYRERMNKDKTKTEFNGWLTGEINKTFNGINIDDIEYNQDNSKIRRILLWHNIYTVCSKESIAFFSFYNYKKEKWSIEHIHAQQSEEIVTIIDFEEWIKPIKYSLKDETRKKVERLMKEEQVGKIGSLTKEVIEELGAGYESDNIENLALLTSADNSSASNKLFAAKRQVIINKEKEGSFIPICTRNVFLKYYTEYPANFVMWEEDDREAYVKDIRNSITVYRNKKGDNR